MPIFLGLVLALIPSLGAQEVVKAPVLSEEERKLNLESFEEVWATVRDKHWDPKLGGLDWQAVHDEFQPRVQKAASLKEVRQLLNDMLDRLQQSHFGIIPNEVYKEVAGGGQDKGVPGFDVRVLDGKAVVFRVEEDEPAAKLGVQPGWEVVQVANEEIGPALKKIAKALKDGKSLERELAVAVMRKLRGNQGDKLEVVFHDGKENRELNLAIPLVKPRGTATKLGQLPTIYVDFEAKKINGNIGYFRLNTFFDPLRVMPAFQKTIQENLNADGFILDLRGNPGGIGGMAMGMGNWFINKDKQKLGTMITRDGSLNFILPPRAQTFDGPLAILVDGLSASTSEILAGGLKDLKRATIIGTKTMGAALPSVVVRLPNQDGFQYAIANYISVGGKALEGHGVEPDLVVPLSRMALLNGRDPVMDAAVEWIEDQKKKKD